MTAKRLLLKNLRLSVMDNSSAYAFSITITGTYALLATIAAPGPLEIFAGAGGAVCAFMVAELLTLLLLREDPQRSDTVKLLGRMLNLLSVGCATGAAYLCGLLLDGPFGWLVAGFTASLIFILLEGLELALAEAKEKGV
ncbi:hypothetical protein GTW51_00795 [Aurantimonas aggregata]|uniref:Uncharacterized protein n=1 Tax=Aurantimonas aggregata TaxID=2047720 RepID=A0A6L9MBR2_9HYPH|nr:hypothetical protein [Aurantimonas aggregata]NDV85233.1 hypothetical protein [Aurantimonas aggregata]